MDIAKFTENKTGQLIPVLTPEPDYAFIPDDLPAKWSPSNAQWEMIVDTEKHLWLLEGVARNLPNPELLLTPLKIRESLTSSRLEGTFATAQQLILFDLNPKEPTSPNDQKNSWLEVSNYNRALAHGYNKLEKYPFCLSVIKELHNTLLTGVRGAHARPGEFREHQVHIESTRRYIPPPAPKALECLYKLEAYINSEDDLNKLVKCFIVHYQFEAIHPFGDGNGRVGRVLLALMIHRFGGLKMPWLYLSPYFERYKDEYINNMFKVSSEGDWSTWIEFCLRGAKEQAQEAVRVCEALKKLRDNMHEKETCGSGRLHATINELFVNPYITISDLARRNNVSYPTAKSDVDFLVKNGILSPLEHLPKKTYVAHEIFKIAYENV
jgi:Fic family protein